MGYSLEARRSSCTVSPSPGMQMVRVFRIWAVALAVFCVLGLATVAESEESVYEAIGRHGDLSQFQERINQDEVLRKMLELWSVTVFAPTDEAFEKNRDWVSRTNVKIVSYHVLNLVANITSFPFVASTSLPGGPPLYLEVKASSHSTDKEYFANNAKIIRTESYRTQEGAEQLLYVIDDVLRPFQGKPFPPMDALNLMMTPSSYNVQQSASLFASKVKEERLQSLFEREGNHTFFIPVDSRSGPSNHLKDAIDPWVIRGHIIPRNVIFTRLVTSEHETFQADAHDNNIQIELTLYIKELPDGTDTMYAQSNTVMSTYGHSKGTVRARIVQANVPVKNGVVHFIERPLVVVSNKILDFIEGEEDPRLEEFRRLMSRAPEFRNLLDNDEEKTLFAPSNEAIRQIPSEILEPVRSNVTAINELLKLHLVKSSISSDDVYFDRHLGCMSRDNCNSLKFRVIGSEHNKTLIVEGKLVQATAIQSDISAVDGIVHIVDRLLGVPFQTVYSKLQTDPDLRITYDLGEQDAWGELLDKHGKHYTFFAPNNEAWAHVRHHMPTEYKQLTMGAVTYHLHKILDRHLIVNKELMLGDIDDSVEVQVVNDKLKVRKDLASGRAEYVVEWEGLKANILQPNIKTINGIIHVIDGVMMKKRDLTQSASSALFPSLSSMLFAGIFLLNRSQLL